MRGKFVCLSYSLAPFVLHIREARLQGLSHWALGTCTPTLRPTFPHSQPEGGWVELLAGH